MGKLSCIIKNYNTSNKLVIRKWAKLKFFMRNY